MPYIVYTDLILFWCAEILWRATPSHANHGGGTQRHQATVAWCPVAHVALVALMHSRGKKFDSSPGVRVCCRRVCDVLDNFLPPTFNRDVCQALTRPMIGNTLIEKDENVLLGNSQSFTVSLSVT